MGVLLLSPQKIPCRCLAGYFAIPQPFCLALEKLCHSTPGAFPHILLLFLLPLLSPQPFPPLELVFVEEFWLLEVCPAQESCQTSPLEFLLDEKLRSTTCPKKWENVGMESTKPPLLPCCKRRGGTPRADCFHP